MTLLIEELFAIIRVSLLKRNGFRVHQLRVGLHDPHCLNVCPVGEILIYGFAKYLVLIILVNAAKLHRQFLAIDPYWVTCNLRQGSFLA